MRCKLRKNGNSWSAIIPIDIARPFIQSGEIDIEIIDEAFGKKMVSGIAQGIQNAAAEMIGKNIPEILKPEEKKEKLDTLRELISAVENKPVEKVEYQPVAPNPYQAYDQRYNPKTGFNEDAIDISEVNDEFLN